MNRKPKESDWKAFRAIVPDLRERYLREKNQEITAILTDRERTPTQQFWDAYEKIREERKTLRACLDDLRRSTMELQMMLMYRTGMLTDSDLEGFSPELRERIKNAPSF